MKKKFSVFTPTFNRAHTLPRVYKSLCEQTYVNFEWLIVDDGSTDNTKAVVEDWIRLKKIRIRYLQQKNLGKHAAFNLGVKNASGDLFLPLDSDDTCVPTALESFHQYWNSIPSEIISSFSGITALCRNDKGNIVGGALPTDILDGCFYKVINKLKHRGEMWGFHKTSVLLEFPFPIFAGEKFVPEGLVWNRIAQKYNTRFINEALRTYYTSNDSLSGKMDLIRIQSPEATLLFYKEVMDLNISFIESIKAGINFWKYLILTKRFKLSSLRQSSHTVILLVSLIPGVLSSIVYKLKN